MLDEPTPAQHIPPPTPRCGEGAGGGSIVFANHCHCHLYLPLHFQLHRAAFPHACTCQLPSQHAARFAIPTRRFSLAHSQPPRVSMPNPTVRQIAFATPLLALVCLTGCWSRGTSSAPSSTANSTPPAPCPVAVIDLDRVARDIGAIDKIRAALAQSETTMVAELQQATAPFFGGQPIAAQSFSDFDRVAAPLVEKLSDEQQKAFVKNIRAAQSQFAIRQQQLRIDFLNEVRPCAYQIARDQGCQLVLSTDQVYVATEQVDITSDVIRKIAEINAAAQASAGGAASANPGGAQHPPPKLASGGSFKVQ